MTNHRQKLLVANKVSTPNSKEYETPTKDLPHLNKKQLIKIIRLLRQKYGRLNKRYDETLYDNYVLDKRNQYIEKRNKILSALIKNPTKKTYRYINKQLKKIK